MSCIRYLVVCHRTLLLTLLFLLVNLCVVTPTAFMCVHGCPMSTDDVPSPVINADIADISTAVDLVGAVVIVIVVMSDTCAGRGDLIASPTRARDHIAGWIGARTAVATLSEGAEGRKAVYVRGRGIGYRVKGQLVGWRFGQGCVSLCGGGVEGGGGGV